MTWYKKSDFPQYDVFHGTGDQNSIYEKGFLYEYLGKGNDQYGPGFYFTSISKTAENYSKDPKMQKSPGVIRAKVNLKKPIKVVSGNIDKSDAFDIFPKLNASQVRNMLNIAGDKALSDWGDIEFEGREAVINNVVNAYAGKSSALVMYDFFDQSRFPEALRFITKVTGYDGVVIDHKENIDPDKNNERWVVAWYQEQIQIVR